MKKTVNPRKQFLNKTIFVLLCILLSATNALGQAILAGDRSVPAEAQNGMVVTSHTLATEVALEVLKKGGNAIDAAVAAALTLGVVDGHNSGLGGGCFVLIRTATGELVVENGRVVGGGRMHGGQRSGVTGDHRLNQVQGFAASDFPHDDPVRPHPQRIDEKIANRDFARAVRAWGLGFEIDRVRLVQLKFRTVFDHDNAFRFRNFGGECVEQ